MIRDGARRRGLSATAVLVGLALTLAACATTPVAGPVPDAARLDLIEAFYERIR